MTDAEIYAVWQKHEAKRVGRRTDDFRGQSAVDDTADELQMPYSRVRAVVMARLFAGFGG
jgi:hypothetical protein